MTDFFPSSEVITASSDSAPPSSTPRAERTASSMTAAPPLSCSSSCGRGGTTQPPSGAQYSAAESTVRRPSAPMLSLSAAAPAVSITHSAASSASSQPKPLSAAMRPCLATTPWSCSSSSRRIAASSSVRIRHESPAPPSPSSPAAAPEAEEEGPLLMRTVRRSGCEKRILLPNANAHSTRGGGGGAAEGAAAMRSTAYSLSREAIATYSPSASASHATVSCSSSRPEAVRSIVRSWVTTSGAQPRGVARPSVTSGEPESLRLRRCSTTNEAARPSGVPPLLLLTLLRWLDSPPTAAASSGRPAAWKIAAAHSRKPSSVGARSRSSAPCPWMTSTREAPVLPSGGAATAMMPCAALTRLTEPSQCANCSRA